MAYALGAAHGPVSGGGSLSVAAPIGLLLETTSIPPTIGAEFGVPMYYRGLGHITPATADGWLPRIAIHYEDQLVLPLPPDVLEIGYELVDDADLVVTELVAAAPVIAPTLQQPWDRNGAAVGASALLGLPGGSGVLSGLTYTVPTGRRLWLTSLSLRLLRLNTMPAASLTTPGAWWTVGGSTWRQIRLSNLLVEATDSYAGPLVLSAGTTITARGENGETGGWIYMDAAYAGILFDA